MHLAGVGMRVAAIGSGAAPVGGGVHEVGVVVVAVEDEDGLDALRQPIYPSARVHHELVVALEVPDARKPLSNPRKVVQESAMTTDVFWIATT